MRNVPGLGLSGNTITGNGCKGEGGGILLVQGQDAILSANWIESNDADPLFADAAAGDLHLLYGSPCRDAGTFSPDLPETDFEGDPRAAGAAPDMGADEFHRHLYVFGESTPGKPVSVKIMGLPGATPVGLFIGSGVLDPPLPSPFGDWYLAFPVTLAGPLGPVPPEGLLVLSAIVPPDPPPPYDLPLQALVGPALTNLTVMAVH